MKSWITRLSWSLTVLALLSGMAHSEGDRLVLGIHAAAKDVPEITFNDVTGKPFTLADFEGQYVLLNVWATWCPPCRKELPDLQGLQQKLGGAEFQVIAMSTDAGRLESVKRLYQELNLDEGGIFIDETGSAMRALGVFAMPTTLLIEAKGREIGRKPGPADWDSAEAVAFFEEQMERGQ